MRERFCVAVLIGFLLLCLPLGCNTDRDAGETTAPASEKEAPEKKPTDLAPFAVDTSEGERYGYRDATGQVHVEPQFLVADAFSGSGLAAVVDESGWAYIDTQGQVVVRPFVFDNGPDPFSEGLARFVREGRFGYFDERGKTVIEPRFDFARPFSQGLAAVCSGCVRKQDGEHSTVSGGKWGYINKSGDEAIPFVFDEADSFEGGRARVVEVGESKWIGPDGHPLQ